MKMKTKRPRFLEQSKILVHEAFSDGVDFGADMGGGNGQKGDSARYRPISGISQPAISNGRRSDASDLMSFASSQIGGEGRYSGANLTHDQPYSPGIKAENPSNLLII